MKSGDALVMDGYLDTSTRLTDVSLGDLVDAIGGELRFSAMPPRDGELSPLERIVVDPAHLEAGDVYWDVAEDDDEAADFAYEAMMRGAVGVVSRRRVEPLAGRWSLVNADPLLALWELARWKRTRFTGSVVAVAGAVGKSTAAAMIDCVLRTRLAGTTRVADGVSASPAAIPLALLSIDSHDDYAVVEMNEKDSVGDGAARLCRPKVAVALGNSDSAADLIAALPAESVAVVCGDDEALCRVTTRTAAKIVRFGRNGDCDIAATNIRYRQGCLRFDVAGVTIVLNIWGRHHLHAALAAFAAGRELGFTPDEIAAALAEFQLPPARCEVSHAHGLTIIHDAPREHAESFAASLDVLRETEAAGRRFVVCGEFGDRVRQDRTAMREFGDQVVSRCAADRLIACGAQARDIVTGARDAGMPLPYAVVCQEFDDAASYLADEAQDGDVLLFKAAPKEAIHKTIRHIETRRNSLTRAA